MKTNWLEHPIRTSVLITVVMLILGGAASLIASLCGASPAYGAVAGAFTHLVFAIVMASRMGGLPFASPLPTRWRALPLLIVPLIIAAVPWIGTTLVVPYDSPLHALIAEEALTGLAEELLYRGVILSLFLRAWRAMPGGVWKAVVAQAVLFGVAHVVVADLVVIVSATVAGILFAAVVIRIGSLWPLAIIHGAGNLGYRLLVDDGTAAFSAIITGVLFAAFVLIYSRIILLRGEKSALPSEF